MAAVPGTAASRSTCTLFDLTTGILWSLLLFRCSICDGFQLDRLIEHRTGYYSTLPRVATSSSFSVISPLWSPSSITGSSSTQLRAVNDNDNNLQFRQATGADVSQARLILARQAMNPLSISEERLLVTYYSNDNIDNDISDTTQMLGFGQIRPLNRDDESNSRLFFELASLYVMPSERGKGIGSALAQKLLERHYSNPEISDNSSVVCLLTLASTTEFYLPFGFETLSSDQVVQGTMPSSLVMEYKAGTMISKFLGNELVCMVKE